MADSNFIKAQKALEKWPEGVQFTDERLREIESAARALRGIPIELRELAARALAMGRGE